MNIFQKFHTWYTSQILIIKSFQISLFNIKFSQYYITIESFIYEEHYLKVYWVNLIYFWSDRCFCTTLKVHNKLNIKDLTMKLMFQCMSSFLTWIPFHHLHISIGINYYWKSLIVKNELSRSKMLHLNVLSP
jgi:hypothetical protein